MAATLRGQVDVADRRSIRGWAQDDRWPDQPVSLLVTLNGTLIGRCIANRFRHDLADAGIGDGRHGFELIFGAMLSPLGHHRLRVTRELDGLELAHSPWLLEPAPDFDPSTLDRLETLLLDGVEADPTTIDQRLEFLRRQIDRLLEFRAKAITAPLPGNDGTDPGGTMLVIDELMPDADRDAGSGAVISHMQAFRRLGLTVLFAAADFAADPRTVLQAERLAGHGITPCRAPFYASVEEVLRRHAASLQLVYLHRGPIAFRYARLVRHLCPKARIVYAVADLAHIRLARQAEAQERPELLALARQTRARELDCVAVADATLTHSAEEASIIQAALPGAELHVVPWSVPVRPVVTGFAARRGVAFLADYAHAPNLDAALRLVREIMPLVWEHEPDMPCLLAGSRLPPALANAGDARIVPVGHVPVLVDLFERVRLTVAPLVFGAGIKGKVMQSLAAGIPCVCTPVAVEGLQLPPVLAKRVAASTHDFAREIVWLHRDAAANAEMAQAGLEWAEAALSETRLDGLLAAVARLAPGLAHRES
ncbi:glycosyltransferase [Lichenicola sp.]|uniref:glycosyltransferase n=1 Tax=Lichenicola sp. TaxID=2804529 RepID=UPI003B00183D